MALPFMGPILNPELWPALCIGWVPSSRDRIRAPTALVLQIPVWRAAPAPLGFVLVGTCGLWSMVPDSTSMTALSGEAPSIPGVRLSKGSVSGYEVRILHEPPAIQRTPSPHHRARATHHRGNGQPGRAQRRWTRRWSGSLGDVALAATKG